MQFISKYEGPWAEPTPLFVYPTGEWRNQRPIIKSGKCHHCGLCYLLCPTGSIKDTGTYFTANLDYCKGCGICAKECPVSAIMMVREEVE